MNATGIGFFDHMLDQLARHSMIDMTVSATGDLHIDDHHTVEDTGIALGQALTQALGDKRGIRRYGSCLLPMDDALVRCALDLSARPFLIWNADLPTPKIGTFDTELVREFFQALSTHGGITLHIDALHGINSHHIAGSDVQICGPCAARSCRVGPAQRRCPCLRPKARYRAMLTAIIDYESGNLHSAEKAFQRMAVETNAGDIVVTGDADVVARAGPYRAARRWRLSCLPCGSDRA